MSLTESICRTSGFVIFSGCFFVLDRIAVWRGEVQLAEGGHSWRMLEDFHASNARCSTYKETDPRSLFPPSYNLSWRFSRENVWLRSGTWPVPVFKIC